MFDFMPFKIYIGLTDLSNCTFMKHQHMRGSAVVLTIIMDEMPACRSVMLLLYNSSTDFTYFNNITEARVTLIQRKRSDLFVNLIIYLPPLTQIVPQPSPD